MTAFLEPEPTFFINSGRLGRERLICLSCTFFSFTLLGINPPMLTEMAQHFAQSRAIDPTRRQYHRDKT